MVSPIYPDSPAIFVAVWWTSLLDDEICVRNHKKGGFVAFLRLPNFLFLIRPVNSTSYTGPIRDQIC